MESKSVITFPYINISQVIKMDDFEIHPFDSYDLNTELTPDEIVNINKFTSSFRESFFKEWENPKKQIGIWILRFKWSIIRDASEVESIHDCLKILFLLLKLHVSHDFFNAWMNHIDVKSFSIFGFNVLNNTTSKFWNMWECKDLHTTIPENISWLWNIKLFPIAFCTNNIPVEFKMFSGWEKVFWVDSDIINLTEIYKRIISNTDYYKKFLNIASVYLWLEQQNDLFFYYSIIPSIIEVLLQLDSNDIKKQKAIEFWKLLDSAIVQNNDIINTVVYTKRNGDEVKEDLWIIARTFILIYDLRNLLLHEWEKSFEKMKVDIHGVEIRIYDIFQLIFKYTILYDLIEKWVIENNFIKVSITWNPLTSLFTGEEIKIEYSWSHRLSLDQELDWLIRKNKSDRDLALNK